MAPKRKSAAAPKKETKEEPPTKEQKTEPAKAPEEPKPEAPAEAKPAEPDNSEKEVNAAKDSRPAIKEAVTFPTPETSLNVVPTMGGKVLCSLTDGGMQYLIAGARANVGVKAGRYMYEIKILEALATNDHAWGRNAPKPRQLLRIGFSTAGSSLYLGDDEAHIFFDSEGFFCADKKKVRAATPFFKDQAVSVLLNLDPKSPNANTISLFREGERLSPPQPVPESLRGKALFPHLSFRNFTVQVNMGPEPLKPLPFTCRMLGGAAQADVEVAANKAPKDGKYEVLVPVGYPDEGTFDWLDSFLEKNPHYVELSDRKILDWAASSGLWRSKSWGRACLDKPDFNFGLPGMDDFSVRKVLAAVSTVIPRSYVVMEVKGNLLEQERKTVLSRFSGPHFKKTALVVMGEPSKDFKDAQLDRVLKAKQAKSDSMWKLQQAEKKRKKLAAQKAKELAEKKKMAEEARKKAQEEAKKKKEEAEKKEEGKDGEEKKEGEKEEKKEEEPKMEVDEEKKDEEKTDEEKKDEEKKDEEKKDEAMEVEEEEEEETEPPKAELTDEEKATWFAPKQSYDVKDNAIASSFANFSLPEKSEGFDDVKFEWSKEAQAKEYLRSKIVERKRTSRIETLQPSQWFNDKAAEWKKLFAGWQKKQEEFKSSPAQKAKAAAKKVVAEKGDDDESKEVPAGDIFSIEDICDIEGEPLFKDFEFADWALMQLRFELYMLQAAFKKDVDDPDRPGIPEAHFNFYFSRYFKKNLTPKTYGVDNTTELCKLLKDTVAWENAVLTSPVDVKAEDDMTHFVKLSEEHRRERQRRIDAGDETARLKINPNALGAPPPAKLAQPVKPVIAPKLAEAAVAKTTITVPTPPAAPSGGAKGVQKGGAQKKWEQAPKASSWGSGGDSAPAWKTRGEQPSWGKGGKGGGKPGKKW